MDIEKLQIAHSAVNLPAKWPRELCLISPPLLLYMICPGVPSDTGTMGTAGSSPQQSRYVTRTMSLTFLVKWRVTHTGTAATPGIYIGIDHRSAPPPIMHPAPNQYFCTNGPELVTGQWNNVWISLLFLQHAGPWLLRLVWLLHKCLLSAVQGTVWKSVELGIWTRDVPTLNIQHLHRNSFASRHCGRQTLSSW